MKTLVASLSITLLLPMSLSAGISAPKPTPVSKVDLELQSLIKQHGLTGDPAKGRSIPSIHSPEAQLGKRLFFNKALGGTLDTACVTCHHPLLGGSDDLAVSIGVKAVEPDLLGKGRTNHDQKPVVPRNSPTTFNTILWDETLFWDGRVESMGKEKGQNGAASPMRSADVLHGQVDPLAGKNLVHAQARFPITSHEEMRDDFVGHGGNQDLRDALAARLRGESIKGDVSLPYPEYWLGLFEEVYGPAKSKKDLITEQRISHAIGEYERSQVFVENPWSEYVKGDVSALSDSAKRGALLFYRSYKQGGANCVACHSGDKFTNEKFYNLAMPQLGVGKGDGRKKDKDFGRGRETGKYKERFAFRTPSLLNVAGTAPYSHAGAYTNLEDVIRHHLNPRKAIRHYKPDDIQKTNPGLDTKNWRKNTKQALKHLRKLRKKGQTPLRNVKLSDAQVSDLVTFVHSLTDPCIKSEKCLSPWIADEHDPNGLNLEAKFKF